MTLEQIIRELRRPFTPEAVQFKLQTAKGSKALIVSYIDARQVAERLNHVCPEQWETDYNPVDLGSQKGIECGITLSLSNQRKVRRADVGVNEGGFGGLKAVYSDAFKRSAVHWGVGVPNYYTPVFYGDKAKLENGKYLGAKLEKDARTAYAKWLKAEGIERFGEPLDLGDTLESQGDVEVGEEEAAEMIAANPVTPEMLAANPASEMPPEENESEPVEMTGDEFAEAAELETKQRELQSKIKGYLASNEDSKAAKSKLHTYVNANGLPGPNALGEMTLEQTQGFIDFLDIEGAGS